MKKIKLLYKQFGFLYLIKSLIKRVFSPIIKTNSFIIVAIESHKKKTLSASVVLINSENKSVFIEQTQNLPLTFLKQLNSFIKQGTFALVVILNNEIAGWGFIQKEGNYTFAGYNYIIPPKVWVLKNLFVVPEYRGQSIGKIINEARINIIDDNQIPLVFVIPSNKYALRNLEMFGFVKQVFVRDTLWFNTYHKRKIKRLKENNLTQTIEKGFQNGE